MANNKAKKKAVKKVEKAVRKAVKRGVTEGAVEKAVSLGIATADSKKPARKADARKQLENNDLHGATWKIWSTFGAICTPPAHVPTGSSGLIHDGVERCTKPYSLI